MDHADEVISEGDQPVVSLSGAYPLRMSDYPGLLLSL